MKQVVLAAMVMMTMASSVSAANDWDIFWGTTVSQALDPKTNGWDEFWYQCQDPNKNIGDCVGTVATGIFAAAAFPVVAVIAATGAGFVAGTLATTVPTTAGTVWAAASPIGITASGTFIF